MSERNNKKAHRQHIRPAVRTTPHELSASGQANTPDGQFSVTYKSSGPHYDPILVQAYERIQPGLGVKIVENSIAQSSHRMKMEDRQQLANISQSKIGQITGACFGLLGLAIGVYLAVNGYEIAASTVFGSTVLGLAAIFAIGKTKQSDERKMKNSSMSEILGKLLNPNPDPLKLENGRMAENTEEPEGLV